MKSSNVQPGPDKRPRKRSWRRRLLVALVALPGIIAVLVLGVVPLLAWLGAFNGLVESRLEDSLGCKANVAELRFWPLSSLDARDVTLTCGESRLSIRNLHVDFSPIELAADLKLEEIVADGARLVLARDAQGKWQVPGLESGGKGDGRIRLDFCRRISMRNTEVVLRLAATGAAGTGPGRELVLRDVDIEVKPAGLPQNIGAVEDDGALLFSAVATVCGHGARSAGPLRVGVSGSVRGTLARPHAEAQVIVSTEDIGKTLGLAGELAGTGGSAGAAGLGAGVTGVVSLDAAVLYETEKAKPGEPGKLSIDVITNAMGVAWTDHDTGKPRLSDGRGEFRGMIFVDLASGAIVGGEEGIADDGSEAPAIVILPRSGAFLDASGKVEGENVSITLRTPGAEDEPQFADPADAGIGDVALFLVEAGGRRVLARRIELEARTGPDGAKKKLQAGLPSVVVETGAPGQSGGSMTCVVNMETPRAEGTGFDQLVGDVNELVALLEMPLETESRADAKKAKADVRFSVRFENGGSVNANAEIEPEPLAIAPCRIEAFNLPLDWLFERAGLPESTLAGRGRVALAFSGKAARPDSGPAGLEGRAELTCGAEGDDRVEFRVPVGAGHMAVFPPSKIRLDLCGEYDTGAGAGEIAWNASIPQGVRLRRIADGEEKSLDALDIAGCVGLAVPAKETATDANPPGAEVSLRELRVAMQRGLAGGGDGSALERESADVGHPDRPGIPAGGPEPVARFRAESQRDSIRRSRVSALLALTGAAVGAFPVDAVRQAGALATGGEYLELGLLKDEAGPGDEGDRAREKKEYSVRVEGRNLRHTTIAELVALGGFVADEFRGARKDGESTGATGPDGAQGEEPGPSLLTQFLAAPTDFIQAGTISFFGATTQGRATPANGAGAGGQEEEYWDFRARIVPQNVSLALGYETFVAEKVRGDLEFSGRFASTPKRPGAGTLDFCVDTQTGFEAILLDKYFIAENGLQALAAGRYSIGQDGAGGLRLTKAEIVSPTYGRCDVRGEIAYAPGAGGVERLDVDVVAAGLVHETLFRDFVRDPLGEMHTFLKKADWTGCTDAVLRLRYPVAVNGESPKPEETEAPSADDGSQAGRRFLKVDGTVRSGGDIRIWETRVKGYRLDTPVSLLFPASPEAATGGDSSSGSTEPVAPSDGAIRIPVADREDIAPLHRGWFRIAEIESGPISIPAIATRFAASGNSIFLYDPVSFELFGGQLGLEGIQMESLWGGGAESATLRCKGRASGVDLELMSTAYGLRFGLEGTVSADFKEVEISEDRVLLKGGAGREKAEILMEAFGGETNIFGVGITRPFSDMRGLTLSADFKGIELEQVTRVYEGVGKITGILQGRIDNLEVLGGDVIGFEAWVENVPQSGGSQKISSQAVQSLKKFTSGMQGLVEDFIRQRDWPYTHLGIYAKLRGGKCLFRGRYFRHAPFMGLFPSVGKLPDEYVAGTNIDPNIEEFFVIHPMGGVNVINGTPGNTIRYDSLVGTVKSVLEGKRKARVE
ncbi:MAG: hypothetical protein RDV41_04890 [Planctomycetota bacterium]|nr:hypothetical protein [Planctomycetota bacterium]